MKNGIRGLLKARAPVKTKQALWNREFANGRWAGLEHTMGDCVYGFVEKYARNGDILDLGCGSGNSSVELDAKLYGNYLGVDVSDVALARAAKRSEAAGRSHKNSFYQADVTAYVPKTNYNVILLRESVYYIPIGRISETLRRYAGFLKRGGVMVVRLCDREAYCEIVDIIQTHFRMVERFDEPTSKTVVLVFS
jgi:trans-aconitate methyltransferase